MIKNQNKHYYILNFMAILLAILPIALFTGPFIPDLIVVMLSICFLFYCYKKKKFYFIKNLFSILFIIFVSFLVLRSIFAQNPIFSLKTSLFYIRFGFFVLSILLILRYYKNASKFLYKTLYFSTFFVSFDVIFQYIFGYNLFSIVNKDPSRITGIFGSEAIVGSYLVRLVPLTLFLYFVSKKNEEITNFLLITILLIFADIAILLSGERAAFFLLILHLLFLFFFSKKFFIFRFFSLSISIIFISVISLNSSLVKERMFISTFSELKVINESKSTAENNSNRFFFYSENHNAHFQTAYKMYLDNKLFGQGPNMFRILCRDPKYNFNESSCSTHPHNHYLQILSEIGLVGLSFVIFIIYFLISELFRSFKKIIIRTNDNLMVSKKILLSIFFMTLWPFITTGNFFNNWLNIIYFFPIPFYIHNFVKHKL
jgi:O-antigen ligase